MSSWSKKLLFIGLVIVNAVTKAISVIVILIITASTWKTLRQNFGESDLKVQDVLKDPPYPTKFVSGEHMTLIVVCRSVYYFHNLAAIPTNAKRTTQVSISIAWELLKSILGTYALLYDFDVRKLPVLFHLFVGLIEVGMACGLIALLTLWSSYSPGNCKDVSTWKYDSLGKHSLFSILSQYWATKKKPTPAAICTLFRTRKVLGIVYVYVSV